MHEFYELKEMLMDEVKELTKKGELTAGSLDTVDKLLNSIKNACKIIMYDEYQDEGEYSSEGGMSNRGGYSNARGRGSNARRDSMGRYSREGGNSYARGGRGGSRGGRGGYSREGGYSYADDNEDKIEVLREAMQDAESEQERMIIKKMIRRMEQD